VTLHGRNVKGASSCPDQLQLPLLVAERLGTPGRTKGIL